MPECPFTDGGQWEGFRDKPGHRSGDRLSLMQSPVLVTCSQCTAPGRMAPGRNTRSREAVGKWLTLRSWSQTWMGAALVPWEERNRGEEHDGLATGSGKHHPKPGSGAKQQHSHLSSSLQSVQRSSCVATMKTRGQKAAKWSMLLAPWRKHLLPSVEQQGSAHQNCLDILIHIQLSEFWLKFSWALSKVDHEPCTSYLRLWGVALCWLEGDLPRFSFVERDLEIPTLCSVK